MRPLKSHFHSSQARPLAAFAALPVIAFCVLLAAPSLTQAQEYNLTYRLPEGQTLKYKRIVEENAFAQLHSNLTAEIFKKNEAFLNITGIESGDDELVMIYLQDTVFVEETPPPPDAAQSVTINNILSQIPIRLTITPRGELKEAVPQKGILALKGLVDQNLSERQLAAMAMFLPKLPDDPVIAGKMWTIATKDTVVPYPNLGERNSLRIQTVNISYRAEGMEKLDGRNCMKITWSGSTLTEEKYIEGGLERYVEETVATDGSYHFDVKNGVLVAMEQQADTEMTTAYYGEKSGIVPYSNKLHTSIRLQK